MNYDPLLPAAPPLPAGDPPPPGVAFPRDEDDSMEGVVARAAFRAVLGYSLVAAIRDDDLAEIAGDLRRRVGR